MTTNLLLFIFVILVLIALILLTSYAKLKSVYAFLIIGVFVLGIALGGHINSVLYNFKTSEYYYFGEANGYNRGFESGFNEGRDSVTPTDNLTFPHGIIDWSKFD